MSTAFQVDAFQNNAFQIYEALAATLSWNLTLTADLADFYILAADFDLVNNLTLTADLVEFARAAARPGISLAVSGDLTIIQPLSAVVAIDLTVSVGEGFLRTAGTIFAPAVEPTAVRLHR